MNKSLKIYLPFPKSYITQKFNVNANVSYSRDGLKGHTAYDWGAKYGSPVPNCAPEAYCYSILNKDHPDLMKYRSVYTLVETEQGVYEVSYGHFDHIYAEVGKTYNVGESLGTVGNSGTVFSGDHEVTSAEKQAGSKAGAHLHGPQIRPVKKVTKRTAGKKYLTDANGYYKKDGFYFEVLDFDNGFNGCVSLAPFSTETLAIEAQKNQLIKTALPIVTAEVEKLSTLTPEERKNKSQKLAEILKGLSKMISW